MLTSSPNIQKTYHENHYQNSKLTLIKFGTINRKSELIKELKKGEKSGFVKNFDRQEFLKTLHQKNSVE